MRHYIVAFGAVLAGIAAVVAQFELSGGYESMPPGDPPVGFIFDFCVTFYAVVYLVGRLLYVMLGSRSSAASVWRLSERHMLLLHLFVLLLLIWLPTPPGAPRGPFWPAVVLTVLMVIVSGAGVIRSFRSE